MQNDKKITKVSDLTIGVKLTKINQYTQYGIYTNIIVSEIKETKTGRLLVFYSYTYTSVDGDVTNGVQKLSNAAISKNTLLSTYNFIGG